MFGTNCHDQSEITLPKALNNQTLTLHVYLVNIVIFCSSIMLLFRVLTSQEARELNHVGEQQTVGIYRLPACCSRFLFTEISLHQKNRVSAM
jgi:hypothetical protein